MEKKESRQSLAPFLRISSVFRAVSWSRDVCFPRSSECRRICFANRAHKARGTVSTVHLEARISHRTDDKLRPRRIHSVPEESRTGKCLAMAAALKMRDIIQGISHSLGSGGCAAAYCQGILKVKTENIGVFCVGTLHFMELVLCCGYVIFCRIII